MKRRKFIKTVTASAATGLGFNLLGSSCSMNKNQPNILLIHTDQHRIECLGSYGNKDVKTPNIDSIANDGVRFENSFCPYPVCTPSRYSLLSGLPVHEHRGWTNRCTLSPDIKTFPSILKATGYKTKAIGKMHFTPTYLDVGFEEMILAEQDGPGRWDDDYHRDLMKMGLVDRNDLEDQRREYRKNARQEYWETCGALPSNLPEKYHSTAWIADHAVKELDTWKNSGNMMMAGFIKPHHPFDPPDNWTDMYDPDKLTLLPGFTNECLPRDSNLTGGYFPHVQLTEKKLRLAMALYYACISQIDFHVGRMIEVLKRKGIYDNTMIIFTSDHGEHLGYHHQLLKGGYMYDSIAKVPLIIKYPLNRGKGTVSNVLVNNVDLAPTILKQAGCSPSQQMQGFDLYNQNVNREFVFAHNWKGSGAMARSKTRKLLYHPTRKSLFLDLEKDPTELVDVYDSPDYQDEIVRFKEAITAWQGSSKLGDTYIDENAPQIKGSNVPPLDRSHRKEIISYYQKKMEQLTN